MAGSVNRVILVGNVGKDPEFRSTQGGDKIGNISLATSETWGTGNDRKEKVEWHRVVIFNERISDVVERFVKKGSKIYIEGSLQTRRWTDQGGQEKFSTEVVIGKFNGSLVLLGDAGSRQGGDSDYGGGQSSGNARPSGANQRGKAPAGDIDDEIPF
jgi:single-strand DNA-binding protein